MDGAALLDSLSEWTLESHPNVSIENRRKTNELFSELKTELLSLLGTRTQVGGNGGSNSLDGGSITIFQPMDEELLRGLSMTDLESRLSESEPGIYQGIQTGGDEDVTEPLGILKRIKLFTGLRKFNNFVDDFEKLRAKINKNMSGYEAETARVKGIIDGLVSSTKQYFLYGKLQTMMRIMRANENTLVTQKEKTGVLEQRIERIGVEMTRLNIELEKYRKTAEKIFYLQSGFWKWKKNVDTKYFWKFTKRNFVAKMEHEVEEQTKEYMKLDKEMNYYMAEITNAKQLKILEAAVAGKEVSGLTKTQRSELAEYQKNREKYEKMLSFDEVRRNEYEAFLERKENLLITLAYYRQTLISNNFMGQEKDTMRTNLGKWNTAIDNLYKDLSTSIEKSDGYKTKLKELVEYIADNGNNVSKLIGGMDEFEEIKVEYEKYLTQSKKALETQELIHDTLISIKNKFIELIPDANLLPDMFRVVRAQSFVLSIINNVLAGKQLELGGDFDTGKAYFDQKIRQMHGGAQKGGVYFRNGTPFPNLPAHGTAFYEHADDGRVLNTDATHGAVDYLPAAGGAGQNIKILTLPYGVRQITDEYITKMQDAITALEADRTLYIPLLKISDITKSNVPIRILMAKYIAGTTAFRVIDHNIRTLQNAGRQYEQITGNYYFYNILEDSSVPTGRTDLKRILDDNKFMKIAPDYIILPVFYKLLPVVDNALFRYDEYALIHPLLGGIMSATLRESDLRRTQNGDTDGAGNIVNATSAGYDFKNKTGGFDAGSPYELKLRLKLHDEIDKDELTANNFEYYYNFCGTNMIIKQWTAGQPFYNVQNHSAQAPIGGHAAWAPGNLQPIGNDIQININPNKAPYANYILQLTGHINELVNKIRTTKVDFVGLSMIPPFIGGTAQQEVHEYRFNYMNNSGTTLNLNTNQTTELELLPDKGWTQNYQNNWFDSLPNNQLVWAFGAIQILLMDIITYINTGGKLPLANSAVGDAAKLYSSILGHSATAAGLLPKGADPSALGTVYKTLDPKYRKRVEFLRMALPNTGKDGDYWTTLTKMSKLIKEFSSQDYVDYSGKLFGIYDSMQNIRKFEDKILDIKFKEDKSPAIPEVNLIAKNLETKPPAASKDAYTNAGQKLYDLLKDNKAFIAQNAFSVNPEMLVRDLEPFLRQISKISNNNLILDLEMNNFFSTSPGDQFVDILRTKTGAEKFIKQLENSEYYREKPTISKICMSVMQLLGITPSTARDAYDVYNPHALQNKALLAAKKGKPGRHGAARHHKRHGRHGGGGY